MNKTQWEDGIAAWKKVQEQATIDLEQAELYINTIQQKIDSLEKDKEVK